MHLEIKNHSNIIHACVQKTASFEKDLQTIPNKIKLNKLHLIIINMLYNSAWIVFITFLLFLYGKINKYKHTKAIVWTILNSFCLLFL